MHPYTALCPSCNAEMDLTQKQISQRMAMWYAAIAGTGFMRQIIS